MKSTIVSSAKLLNIAKLIVLAAVIWFLIYKLKYSYNIGELSNRQPISWTLHTILLGSIAIMLMPFNWWLEALKWKVIMHKHEAISTLQSWKSVLTGIALSIVTPNQIGDTVGKALYLESYSKLKGAASTVIGGIAQTIPSLALGCMASLYFIHTQWEISLFQFGLLAMLTFVFISALIYFFLRIALLQQYFIHTKINPYIVAFSNYNSSELKQLLTLSTIRLIVFSSQYYLFLLFFGVDITPLQAFTSISLIFLAQSFLPSFILIEIGIRGAVALFFIGLYSSNIIGILQAAYSLWILNMMIPALVGLYFLLTLKWKS